MLHPVKSGELGAEWLAEKLIIVMFCVYRTVSNTPGTLLAVAWRVVLRHLHTTAGTGVFFTLVGALQLGEAPSEW